MAIKNDKEFAVKKITAKSLQPIGEKMVAKMKERVRKRTHKLEKSLTCQSDDEKMAIFAQGQGASILHLVEYGAVDREKKESKGSTGSMPAFPFFRSTIREFESEVDEIVEKAISESVVLE